MKDRPDMLKSYLICSFPEVILDIFMLLKLFVTCLRHLANASASDETYNSTL